MSDSSFAVPRFAPALLMVLVMLGISACSQSGKSSGDDLAAPAIFPPIEQPPRVMITRIGFDGTVDASSYPVNPGAVVRGIATQGDVTVTTTDADGLNDLLFGLDWDLLQDGGSTRLTRPPKNVLTSYMFDIQSAPIPHPQAWSTSEIDVEMILR